MALVLGTCVAYSRWLQWSTMLPWDCLMCKSSDESQLFDERSSEWKQVQDVPLDGARILSQMHFVGRRVGDHWWFDHQSVYLSLYVTSLCCLSEIFCKWLHGGSHHVWNISVSNALSHTYKCWFVLIIGAVCLCQLIIFVKQHIMLYLLLLSWVHVARLK